MSTLKTDYKQDILAPSMDGKRKFNLVDSEGNIVVSNVHIEDVSSYSQVGDEFNADVINGQNEAINKNASDISEINTHLTAEGFRDTLVSNNIAPSTAWTAIAIKQGRTFSQFRNLSLYIKLGDEVLDSELIDMNYFTSGNYLKAHYNDGATNVEVTIAPRNDTSFQISSSSSSTTTVGYILVGFN